MLEKLRAKVWRKEAYEQLEPAAWRQAGLSAANKFFALAIILGALAAIIETEPSIYQPNADLFETIESLLTVLFTGELFLRLWASAEAPGEQSETVKRLKFLFSVPALLDLSVVIAGWIPAIAVNLVVLRFVRLMRIARLARLGRFSQAIEHLRYAVATRSYELLVSIGLALILLIFGASALYWAEGDIQPDKFGSIPRSLWWSAVTLTTIGYGDVSPITPLGKFIAVIVAVAGIGLVALPTGILASGFSEAVQRDRKDENK